MAARICIYLVGDLKPKFYLPLLLQGAWRHCLHLFAPSYHVVILFVDTSEIRITGVCTVTLNSFHCVFMCKTLAVSSQNVSQRGMLVNLSSHFKHYGDMEIKGFAQVSRVPACQRFILNHPTIHIRQLSPFAYISLISPPEKKNNNNNNINPISDSKIQGILKQNIPRQRKLVRVWMVSLVHWSTSSPVAWILNGPGFGRFLWF